MSMTRAEAIERLEKLIALYEMASTENKMIDYSGIIDTLKFSLSALRPVSREQVEKAWRGEWKHYLPPLGAGNVQCRCTKCGRTPDVETPFCAWCGSPMTDEAGGILLKRLEEMRNG